MQTKKLRPEELLRDYFPGSIKGNPAITFEQLANHTSGLPRLPSNWMSGKINMTDPFAHYDSTMLSSYLASELTLDQDPGNSYAYSNLGAGILAFTLQHVLQKDFEVLLKEIVFDPFNMTSSTCNKKLIENDLVPGLDGMGVPVNNWEFSALVGAGGIYSTVSDLSKFCLANFDRKNKFLSLQREPTFEISDKMNIALGWHILNSKKGNPLHWHNGGTGGYTSFMAIDEKQKNAVVILSNNSALNPLSRKIDQLGFYLMNILD